MDATRANLVEKKDLRRLNLEWEIESTSKLREEIDEKVLEALKPHPNLDCLGISGFSGSSFPVWMAYLENVVEININDCQNCLRLPQLGMLPLLKSLRLENLAVEYIIEDEVEGGDPVNILFPSLETLYLYSLSHLKGLLKEQENTKVFPKLVDLKIYYCSSIVLPEFSSLQKLYISDCSNLMPSSFSKMDSLTSLRVEFGVSMKCIPTEAMEKLSSLKSLTIEKLQEISLPEEGMRALKSLRSLTIEWSTSLTCLPEGWLRHLNYLEHLVISNIFLMVCLPNAIQHLSSLKSLLIYYCPKLASLPACIEGMQNLERLVIFGCPEVERRCQRGTGKDWHKISHIPKLQIGRN